MNGVEELDALRGELRRARRSLTGEPRSTAEAQILEQLLRHPWFRHAQRIACYWPVAGEVDLTPLFPVIWGSGRELALPVVAGSERRMRFHRVTRDTELRGSRLGIPEPRGAALIPRRELDLVLAPLVAFDGAGQRLGMGAGCYDRYLAGLRWRRRPARPRLVGVGFELQRRPALPHHDRDVPLDAVLSERGLQRCSR